MQIDLSQILVAVITLLFGLITRYVIPAMKDKATADQMELVRIAVKTGVYAAEQLFNSDQGKEKFNYVVNLLHQQGYILDPLTVSDTMRAMIEAMVKELHMEQAKSAE